MKGPQPVEVATPEGTRAVEPAVDGRAARSAKTRGAIADALLDLLTEGQVRPTAKEIAQRAGVSVRSVYVHFDDLEDLFCVAADRHFTRIAPMLTPVPSTGSLADRAHGIARQRVSIYAKTDAVGRATRLHAELSPTLARILQDARALSRRDLERVFATELRGLDAARRANTVATLDVLTSADAWQTLRKLHELPADTAVSCVVDSIVLHLRAAAE